MAISGDLRVSAVFLSCHRDPLRSSLSLPTSKVVFNSLPTGVSGSCLSHYKWPSMMLNRCKTADRTPHCSGDYELSTSSASEEVKNFLLQARNMNFLQRLTLAWKILFPSTARRTSSNARIAKQRLKMILFSDRCAVSGEAKRKIVKNIVEALSEFVEIESQEKVQLSMAADSDHGTVYSVTVPVRRVRAEYQEEQGDGAVANVGYEDDGEMSGFVDVRLDFFVPE